MRPSPTTCSISSINPLQLDNLSVVAPDGATSPRKHGEGAISQHLRRQARAARHLQGDGPEPGCVRQLQARRPEQALARQARTIATEIPANATDVKISEVQGRIEVFVTSGKPTDGRTEADRHRPRNDSGDPSEQSGRRRKSDVQAAARRTAGGWPVGRDRSRRYSLSRQAERRESDHRRVRHVFRDLARTGHVLDECLGPRQQEQDRECNAPRRYTTTIEVLAP